MHFVTALHRIAKAEDGPEVVRSHAADKLLDVVAAICRSPEVSTRHLSNTAWALAAVSYRDDTLLASISAASVDKILELDAQNLSNTAWAFATLEMLDLPLFEAITDQVQR